MQSRNPRRKPQKREVTLMTLLANEATKDSINLCKEYHLPKPKNFVDLENQLADVYLEEEDKVALERKLAKMHPHRKWIQETLELVDKKKHKCEKCANSKAMPIKNIRPPKEVIKVEPKQNKELVLSESLSNADGDSKSKSQDWIKPAIYVGGAILVTGILGVALVVASKNFLRK